VFFYRHVLEKHIENELSAVRGRQRRHLPVVLTVREVQTIFNHLSGTARLMTMLFCGCGVRLRECLDPRLKGLALEQNMVIVRSGKRDREERTVR
jgi:integrase